MSAYTSGYRDALDNVARAARSMAIAAHAVGDYDRERAMLDILIVIEREES
jgi:hypothetical protein